MITVLGSIVNAIGKNLYDRSMSTRIFTMIMNKIIMCNLKNREKHEYNLDLDWLTILYKSCVSHPRRSNLAEKVTIQDPSYLNECLGVAKKLCLPSTSL